MRTLLLPLTSILVTAILAVPFKTMVHIDISEPVPDGIYTTPSDAYLDGTHYAIEAINRRTHVIGDVRDGEDVLVEGDPTAATRFVLVVDREDETKYVRVITTFEGEDRFTKTDEFIKRLDDPCYSPVARAPIELDILTQDTDGFIDVEPLADQESYQQVPGEAEETETMSILFTIKEYMRDEAVIDVVKYGDHILDDKVDGLLEREVLWEGGVENPIITIISRHANGTDVTTKYCFIGEDEGFALCGIKRKLVYLYE